MSEATSADLRALAVRALQLALAADAPGFPPNGRIKAAQYVLHKLDHEDLLCVAGILADLGVRYIPQRAAEGFARAAILDDIAAEIGWRDS